MRVRDWLAWAGLFALLMPAAATAQERNWSVDLTGGAIIFQEATSLETGAMVGIEALYQVTPRLSFGPAAEYVRVETDGSFFVSVLNFGADSARAFQNGQQLNNLQYSINGRFDIAPDARFNPFVTAGVGGYTVYLEAQVNDGFDRFTKAMFQVGGGIHYAVSEATGIQIQVKDVVYTDFDRSVFNPSLAVHRNCPVPGDPSSGCRFPEAERDLPDNEETAHNIRISVGLTYVPGLNQ